ncbi:hypothetical protein DXG01_016044 [Tephrocybe rancida]|nr:hypothetical protein DXG01_016044 [Tephrocybe rancida]
MRCPLSAKLGPFIRQAKGLGLCFDLNIKSTPITKIALIFQEALGRHLLENNIGFPQSETPSSLPNAHQYLWNLKMPRMAARSDGKGAVLKVPSKALSDITFKHLTEMSQQLPEYKPPQSALDPTTLPVQQILVGPYQGSGTHYCLAQRMWDCHLTAVLNESPQEIGCDGCEPTPANSSFNNLSTATTPSTQRSQSMPPYSTAHLPADSNTFLTLDGASDCLPSTPPPVAAPFPLSSLAPTASAPGDIAPPLPASSTAPPSTVNSPPLITNSPPMASTAPPLISMAPAPPSPSTAPAPPSSVPFTRNSLSLPSRSTPSTGARSDDEHRHSAFERDGPAVGDGPEISAWAEMTKLISQDGSWVKITEELYTALIHDIPQSAEEIQKFTTYGFVIAMSILWGRLFLPISPFLILLMMHDFQTSIDHTFMQKMTPVIMTRLKTWPPQDNQPINMTSQPGIMISLCLPGTPLPIVRRMLRGNPSQESLNDITQKITSSLIFGTIRHDDLHQHPIICALLIGFEKIFLPSSRMRNMIFSDPRNTLAVLDRILEGCIVASPEQLIARLVVSPSQDENIDPLLRQDALQLLFLQWVARFLRGEGPPSGEGLESAAKEPEDDGELPGAKDAQLLHRSRRLLNALTGSPYLQGPSQKITGCVIHVCTSTMEIVITDHIKSLLNDDVNLPPSVTCPFDIWFYQLLSEDYNDT